MTQSLYFISGNLTAILNQIEENGGELTPELEQALTITEEQFLDKAADYGLAILNLRSMSDNCDKEIKRLKALKDFYDNTEKRLGTAVSNAMQAFDHTKVENPVIRMGLRHTTAVSDDYDLDLVPKEYKIVKVETKLDKKAVKEAILSGKEVPGAHLVENVSLQIK